MYIISLKEYEMDNKKIGELIRKLRRENGWTQMQLATKMNISDKTVSRGRLIWHSTAYGTFYQDVSTRTKS